MKNLATGLGAIRTKRPTSYYSAATACYLAHVEGGQSIRAIAAASDLHPSTVMRRIRRIEMMRDDPLIDRFLADLPRTNSIHSQQSKGGTSMASQKHSFDLTKQAENKQEEFRILRRLCENGAFLAVANDMAKAVVLRANGAGEQTRTAVAGAQIAGALALKDWVRCTKPGKIACYEVTNAGRAALKRFLASASTEGQVASGFAEAPSVFSEQHKEWGERVVSEPETHKPQRMRVNLRESPLATLGRKKGKDGTPFLTGDLVAAGERFREDFELAQIGPRVAQNWESFLTPRAGGQRGSSEVGFSSAQDRFRSALAALGPGLGDIAMRCCCFLEGLEVAEKRMGWSARSGKIVLRIALQRLCAHYQETGEHMRKIG